MLPVGFQLPDNVLRSMLKLPAFTTNRPVVLGEVADGVHEEFDEEPVLVDQPVQQMPLVCSRQLVLHVVM